MFLLMRCQMAGSCTFEAAPFPISVDMLTHVVEDLVMVEVRVISPQTSMVERFSTALVRTHKLVLWVRAVCLLLARQSPGSFAFEVAFSPVSSLI